MTLLTMLGNRHAYKITGTTNNASGAVLGGATVAAYRADIGQKIGTATSDPTTGVYWVTAAQSPSIPHFIRAHKAGSPAVFGTTDENIAPVLSAI